MKQCSRCGQYKAFTDFHKKSSSTDGRQYLCKVCVKGVNKTFRTIKPKYARNWFRANKREWNDYCWRYMKADKTPIIYGIINPANELYIGMTSAYLRIRKQNHFNNFRQGVNKIPKLHQSFQKWGLDAHEFIKIAEYPGISRKELKQKETEWIERFRNKATLLNIRK